MIGDEDDLINQDLFLQMFKNCDALFKELRIMEETEHSSCRESKEYHHAINYL